LAAVLTTIQDREKEAFDALNSELQHWLPEYDSVTFDTPIDGHRSIKLRRTKDKKLIAAADLSEGTLFVIFLLAIAYNPEPPPLIFIEEPDRAVHPRLLRRIRDALFRLSYPTDAGINRKPVQVIATTHSPLFLDLFKDYPEHVVIAEKHADGTASFKRLLDNPDMREILGDAPLGEVWYTGVLGGVPLGV